LPSGPKRINLGILVTPYHKFGIPIVVCKQLNTPSCFVVTKVFHFHNPILVYRYADKSNSLVLVFFFYFLKVWDFLTASAPSSLNVNIDVLAFYVHFVVPPLWFSKLNSGEGVPIYSLVKHLYA
jgi:hypothetical protein